LFKATATGLGVVTLISGVSLVLSVANGLTYHLSPKVRILPFILNP